MILARKYMCSLMMISDMLSKHVGAVKSVLKKWFKINDIQLVYLLVMWYLVNLQDARCNNKDNYVLQISQQRRVSVLESVESKKFEGRFRGVSDVGCLSNCQVWHVAFVFFCFGTWNIYFNQTGKGAHNWIHRTNIVSCKSIKLN